MSNRTKMNKKLRKYSRNETEKFFDNVHRLPFFIRASLAYKLFVGRKIKRKQ